MKKGVAPFPLRLGTSTRYTLDSCCCLLSANARPCGHPHTGKVCKNLELGKVYGH